MDIDLWTNDGVTYIELEGEMNADNCVEIRDMVMEALTVHKRFIIDLQNVPYMDSTSIDTMMSLVREVQFMDGEIKLVGVNPSLGRILELVNAHDVFDLYEKTEQAVASFETSSVRA